MKISKKAEVAPSLTVTINTIAAQKRRKGEDVYNLSVGDPILPCHEKILQRAQQGMDTRQVNYPVVAGIHELRKLLVEWMNANHRSDYGIENTIVSCGGKFILYAASQALLEDGDEVLIPAPYWVSYPEIVKLFGGVPRILPANPLNGWKITGGDIRKNANARTRIILINNACNPTGVLYTREELSDILAACKEKDIIVISDEVYSNVVYDNNVFVSAASFPEYRDRLIIVQSFSKNFGMTGWRIGYAFAPPDFITIINNLQGQCTTGTSLVSQWAAIGAMENAPEVIAYVRNALDKRRGVFLETYQKLFGQTLERPQSAMYVFVPISHFGAKDNDSVKFSEMVMDKANVAIVPGVAFGVEGYVRFSFTETEETIIKGLHKLKETLG